MKIEKNTRSKWSADLKPLEEYWNISEREWREHNRKMDLIDRALSLVVYTCVGLIFVAVALRLGGA